MDRLTGQVAIVTGASRGIGKAVALAFAREGARLAITAVHDRDALAQVEKEIVESCLWVKETLKTDSVPFAFPFSGNGVARISVFCQDWITTMGQTNG